MNPTPFLRTILNDRSNQRLRDKLVWRIPDYAPEWTNHGSVDPGNTLIELFAYLGEILLYRLNPVSHKRGQVLL